MNFIELQKSIGNNLNINNLKLQEELHKDISNIRKAILPVFNFKEFKKKDHPIEHTLSFVFNKLYVILCSMENVVLLNDGWLSAFISRYNYELFIKIKYLLNSESQETTEARIKNFMKTDQRDTIKEKLDSLKNDDDFIKDLKSKHGDFYKKMSSIVHPNIESFNFHINKNSNDIFNFTEISVKFSLFMIYKIIETILNKKDELRFRKYPDFQKIKNIIDKH